MRGHAEYVVRSVLGGWVLQMEGDSQQEVYPTRDEAVLRGRNLVRQYDSGVVSVLGESGLPELTFEHHGEPRH